jgi:hypothetical protein
MEISVLGRPVAAYHGRFDDHNKLPINGKSVALKGDVTPQHVLLR